MLLIKERFADKKFLCSCLVFRRPSEIKQIFCKNVAGFLPAHILTTGRVDEVFATADGSGMKTSVSVVVL